MIHLWEVQLPCILAETISALRFDAAAASISNTELVSAKVAHTLCDPLVVGLTLYSVFLFSAAYFRVDICRCVNFYSGINLSRTYAENQNFDMSYFSYITLLLKCL